MKARVFISCGQAGNDEQHVATELRNWFESEGYEPYVATEVQTILDLNAGIIRELKYSDYYIFINFPREQFNDSNGKPKYRGSLYSHQELAIAYALGFERMLIINHENVYHEGVQKFIVSNTPCFASYKEVLELVKNAVVKGKWSHNFSRHLSFKNVRWSSPIRFRDDTGVYEELILNADIYNGRSDLAAYGLVAHLDWIKDANTDQKIRLEDRSLLKACGRNGFEHTTWPLSCNSFDLLAINRQNPSLIYLHSCLDVPRQPILANIGTYLFNFQFLAQGFPNCSVVLKFEHNGTLQPNIPEIIESRI